MKLFSVLKYLVVIAVITNVIGTVYDAVLQDYRANANHSRVQTACDANVKLRQRKSADFFTDTVDIEQALTPATIHCNTGWRACPLIMLP